MGPSRYDHLNIFSKQPGRRIGLRRGCDGLKRPSGERTHDKTFIATPLRLSYRNRARLQNCMHYTFPLAATAQQRARSSRKESFRVISTARLRTSPPVHLPPINVVVCNDPNGDLILRLASCLDAFSTYPYPTRLPGRAPGGTTGVPEVGPTRSSRTSVRATQISNAHNR